MSPHAIKTIAKIAEDIALGMNGADSRRGGRRILDILEQEGLIPPADASCSAFNREGRQVSVTIPKE